MEFDVKLEPMLYGFYKIQPLKNSFEVYVFVSIYT